MKVNAGKSKVMLCEEEEGLESKVFLNGIRLEHVPELKYLGCVLDESSVDEAECSGRRVSGTIRSLINAA